MQAGAGGDGRAAPPEGTRPGRGTWTWRKREALRDAHLAATKRTIEIKKILPSGYLRSTEETWGLILRAAKSHSCEWRGYKL